jgi:hypothetical protein
MPGPGITISLFDLSAFVPQITNAIVGCVGPATKGPVNQLTDITDPGTLTSTFGLPENGHYAVRSGIRYLGAGNQLKFNRIAGRNLATATLTVYDATGTIPVLIISANSPGSWANSDLTIAITYNNSTPPTSYNVYVYFQGQLVEPYLVMNNGIVVTNINNNSTRITVALAKGAGTTFPGSTVNPVTGIIGQLALAGGNDGAFATTDSQYASLGGFVGKRLYGKMDAIAGNRVWQNLVPSIPAVTASKPTYYGTVGMPVVPGTFTVRVQTAAGPTYIELSDSGNQSYGPGGSGIGYLAPAAGTHVGFVDYRTGNFGVKLTAGATTFLSGTIDGIWIRANSEGVGASLQGTGSYSGTVSSAPNALGFWEANKTIISIPIAEQVGVDAVGGATDANTTAGLKNLAGWIIPGTIVLTPFSSSLPFPNPVYDDGFGGWRTQPNGLGTPVVGAVNYRTGAWSVTWPSPGSSMPAGGVITAAYSIIIFDMGGGCSPGPNGSFVSAETDQPNVPAASATVSSSDTNAMPITGPIIPGTLRMVISATSLLGTNYPVYDDGLGNWLSSPRGTPGTVSIVGSINYATGAWTITVPSGTVSAAATIQSYYVSQVQDFAVRTLRGTGDQALGAGGFLAGGAGGLKYDDPSATNAVPFEGASFFNHDTGQFAFKLQLTPLGAGTQSFDLLNGGTLQAVYMPVEAILGYGNITATQTIFTGQLDKAPYRRENNRLMGFQSAEDSLAGAGNPFVTFSTLGATNTADYWSENVVLSTNPNNFIRYNTGGVSIDWTGAPQYLEAVYVLAEDTILHVTANYPGDIGNERTNLPTGFYVSLSADPSLTGALLFQTWFNGVLQESFGQALTVQALINEVNNLTTGSQLVTLQGTPSGINGTVIADVLTTSQNAGLDGAFTMADVIGAKIGQVYTGLQQFLNDEVVAVNWLMIPGQWHAPVITALQQLCEHKNRFAMAIVPAPDLTDPLKARDFFDGNFNSISPGGLAVPTVTVPYPPMAAINSRMLATVVPWVQYFDAYTNQEVNEPPDGDMAYLIGGTPAPWQPIAGLNRGQVLVDNITYSASSDDRDLIYGLVGNQVEVVNAIILKQGLGFFLYGQRTCLRVDTDPVNRINVSWTVNDICNLLLIASQKFLFEIDDPILWRDAQQALNQSLQPIIEGRGLEDALVVLDSTTTTPTDQDNLTMNGNIFIKPANATEYIRYNLYLTPDSVNFANVVLPGS